MDDLMQKVRERYTRRAEHQPTTSEPSAATGGEAPSWRVPYTTSTYVHTAKRSSEYPRN